jgi:hypothetical protein
MRCSLTDYALAFLAGFVIAVATHGCKHYSPSEQTLIAVHSAAHGMATADALVAPRCGVSSPAPECSAFVDAYAVTRASLLAAERAADEWRRLATVESACLAREALRGARGDLDALLAILASLHVAVPDEVASAIRTLASIAAQLAPQCGGGAQ